MKQKLTPEEEMEILRDCIQKNRCDRLIEQYEKLIRRIVVKMFKSRNLALSPEDLEDRYHDVLEALFKKDRQRLKYFDPKHGLKLSKWIILVTTQTMKDYWKRKTEFLNITDEKIRIPAEDLDFFSGQNHFERQANAEKQCLLRDVIEKLPPDQKLVIKLEYSKRLSPREIGEFMGKTTNNIYQIKRRAIKTIRKIWKI